MKWLMMYTTVKVCDIKYVEKTASNEAKIKYIKSYEIHLYKRNYLPMRSLRCKANRVIKEKLEFDKRNLGRYLPQQYDQYCKRIKTLKLNLINRGQNNKPILNSS